jgi:peptidoglycan/xylan/chitin deacetylase (PgdA/CDA1 family)
LWSDTEEHQRIASEDRAYALNANVFEEQVACIAAHSDRRVIRISFDDGHASACRIAHPILQKYGLTASLFVTTDWLGNRDGYCGDKELEQLKEAGWTIGAHGHTHRFLTTLYEDELAQELQQSKCRLKQYLGESPSLSFPGGRFGKREIEMAKRYGFVSLYGSRPAYLSPGRDIVLPRYAVRDNTSMRSFKNILSAKPTSRVAHLAPYYFKSGLRKVLGDDLYHSVYRHLRS